MHGAVLRVRSRGIVQAARVLTLAATLSFASLRTWFLEREPRDFRAFGLVVDSLLGFLLE